MGLIDLKTTEPFSNKINVVLLFWQTRKYVKLNFNVELTFTTKKKKKPANESSNIYIATKFTLSLLFNFS